VGQRPDAIRGDIEVTRARMGATIEALGDKVQYTISTPARIWGRTTRAVTTAPTKAWRRVTGNGSVPGGVASRASGLKENLVETRGDHIRREDMTYEPMDETGDPLGTSIRRNALLVAIGAFAVAFVVGLLIPRTHVRERRLASVAGNVTHKAVEAGQEALGRGRRKATEAIQNLSQRS
jgi:hypothetical protein